MSKVEIEDAGCGLIGGGAIIIAGAILYALWDASPVWAVVLIGALLMFVGSILVNRDC